MNLSNVAALSGVAPSTRSTLLLPGTFGSASRVSTSVSASGMGSGAVGVAVTMTGVDAGGVTDDVADAGTLGSLCEHPESPTATTAAAAVRATDRCRCIHSVSRPTRRRRLQARGDL